MKRPKECLLIATFIASVFSQPSFAAEVAIKGPDGEKFIVHVESQDSFCHVMEQIESILDLPLDQRNQYLQEQNVCADHQSTVPQKEFMLDYMLASGEFDFRDDSQGSFEASPSNVPRNYQAPVSPQEKKDIAFIVNTLAKSSLVSLLRQKGDLERTGNRINHVHPLRFLMTVFSDEEMKVSIRNIRPRGWVWDDFIRGLRDSLSEESARGNLTEDQIASFASALDVNPSAINPSIQGKRWDEFVDILIKIIPRKGDPSRYGS